MRTTRYFDEQVKLKRPYIDVDLCRAVIASPLRRERQQDGRIRFWGRITLPGEATDRILRVVTLADGKTIHNAFLDRGYREDKQ